MRCKICDSSMEKPVWNRQLGDWEVCGVCLEIIFSVFTDSPEQERDEEPTEEDIFYAEEDVEKIVESEGYHFSLDNSDKVV